MERSTLTAGFDVYDGSSTDSQLQWVLEQCVISGFKPSHLEEATSAQELFDMVQDGVGTAIVPRGICDEIPAAFDCSLIAGMEPLPLVLAYRRAAPHRVQKTIREIANSLRRANLDLAS